MALTLAKVDKGFSVGSQRASVYKITAVGTYTTGGLALAATDIGLRKIHYLQAGPSAGYSFVYDYTNSKLLVYQGDNANVGAAPGIEVPNTTNLAAVNTRLHAIGY